MTNYTPPSEQVVHEPGYIYHGTATDRLYDIMDSGYVDIHKPWHGTEQGSWPDGSTEKRSYWSNNPATVANFVNRDHGKPIIIRTRHDPSIFKKEKGTGDIVTTKRIPISKLEVLVNNKWEPVSPT